MTSQYGLRCRPRDWRVLTCWRTRAARRYHRLPARRRGRWVARQPDGLFQLPKPVDRRSLGGVRFRSPLMAVVSWLALSGGACLLERLGGSPLSSSTVPTTGRRQRCAAVADERRCERRAFLEGPGLRTPGAAKRAARPRETLGGVTLRYAGSLRSAMRVKGPSPARPTSFRPPRAAGPDVKDAAALMRSGLFLRA